MWPQPNPDQTLRRPHFSPRQLVTADDLNAGVSYLVERSRRHNRYLHGCGIVCGLQLDASMALNQDTLDLSISAGAAIGPHGDMITVPARPSLLFNAIMTGEDSYISVSTLIATLLAGGQDEFELHLLLRHTGGPPDDLRPEFPDLCRDGSGALLPTRLTEGYALALATTLPPDCAAADPPACGPLLDPTRSEHAEELMNLFSCRPPSPKDQWVVVGSIVLNLTIAGQIAVAVHYRHRTLLPSARALLELLRCFPEQPCIESATVKLVHLLTRFFVYEVTLKGVGLAPLVSLEVEGLSRESISVQPTAQSDRRIVFFITTPLVTMGPRFVRVETEFDAIDSADYGVRITLSERGDVVVPPGGGVIGGDNL